MKLGASFVRYERGFLGYVTEQVISELIVDRAPQSVRDVVRVVYEESAGLVGQLAQDIA